MLQFYKIACSLESLEIGNNIWVLEVLSVKKKKKMSIENIYFSIFIFFHPSIQPICFMFIDGGSRFDSNWKGMIYVLCLHLNFSFG